MPVHFVGGAGVVREDLAWGGGWVCDAKRRARWGCRVGLRSQVRFSNMVSGIGAVWQIVFQRNLNVVDPII